MEGKGANIEMNTYYLSDTILGTLYKLLFTFYDNAVNIPILQMRNKYPHFTNEKTEVQSDGVMCHTTGGRSGIRNQACLPLKDIKNRTSGRGLPWWSSA